LRGYEQAVHIDGVLVQFKQADEQLTQTLVVVEGT